MAKRKVVAVPTLSPMMATVPTPGTPPTANVFPMQACLTKMQMAGYSPLQAGNICGLLKKKYMLQQGM